MLAYARPERPWGDSLGCYVLLFHGWNLYGQTGLETQARDTVLPCTLAGFSMERQDLESLFEDAAAPFSCCARQGTCASMFHNWPPLERTCPVEPWHESGTPLSPS